MTDQAQHESAGTDRQIVEAWIRANTAGTARLTEVPDSDDDESWRSLRPHGVVANAHPFLIVNFPDRLEMIRARPELTSLVAHPQNLRIRRWKPSASEIDRIRTWLRREDRPVEAPAVTMTAPHPGSGLLMVGLSAVDREYAERLERMTDGLAYVLRQPERFIPL